MDSVNELDILLRQMMERGLAATSRDWIERAVQEKNPRLTIALACSKLLVYDPLERKLASREVSN